MGVSFTSGAIRIPLLDPDVSESLVANKKDICKAGRLKMAEKGASCVF